MLLTSSLLCEMGDQVASLYEPARARANCAEGQHGGPLHTDVLCAASQGCPLASAQASARHAASPGPHHRHNDKHGMTKRTSRVQPVLAGNTVHNDYQFMRKRMPRLHAALNYRLVDVSSINELCKRWMRGKLSHLPGKQGNHRAMDDVWESITELRVYQEHVFNAQPHKKPAVVFRRAADHASSGAYLKELL